MVQGRPGQAHRPGHVREDLIPKKPDGPAEPPFVPRKEAGDDINVAETDGNSEWETSKTRK